MRRPVLVSCAAALALVASAAHAEDDEGAGKWVDRPMVLAPYHASFAVGVSRAELPTADGAAWGTGSNFEAVLGLPNLLELGVRTGVRANDVARAAGADRWARTFDHESSNLGGDELATPEIRLRGSLADFHGVVAVGVESRFIVARAEGTHFTVAPGIPLRIHLGEATRIDTGVFVPFRSTADAIVTVSLPVEVYFQLGDFFFGPATGVRYHRIDGTPKTNRVDVPAGLALGWTLFRRLDLGAQLYSYRINDEEWKHTLGFGFGAQVTVP